MIALPPLLMAANATLAALLGRRVTPVIAGLPGVVAAVNGADELDAEPSPTALVARTVHVYDAPFVRLETVSGETAPDALFVAPPPDEHVAVYPVIGSPPLLTGLENATRAALFVSRVTPVIAGWPGTVCTVIWFDGADAALVPTEFVAVTVHR
ncbi:MAG TPA: hypothetical protein VN636_09465 [Acidimicrobiia bacterium]|nr:hypothetical protein [Acidimicrobiia bacterium]